MCIRVRYVRFKVIVRVSFSKKGSENGFFPSTQSVSCLFSISVKYLFYILAMNTFKWQADTVGNVIGRKEEIFGIPLVLWCANTWLQGLLIKS